MRAVAIDAAYRGETGLKWGLAGRTKDLVLEGDELVHQGVKSVNSSTSRGGAVDQIIPADAAGVHATSQNPDLSAVIDRRTEHARGPSRRWDEDRPAGGR